MKKLTMIIKIRNAKKELTDTKNDKMKLKSNKGEMKKGKYKSETQ